MMLPPNQPVAVANVVQLATDLARALDGYAGGQVTSDAIDGRARPAVTVREALTALRKRIDCAARFSCVKSL
jgi:hypothetical protein